MKKIAITSFAISIISLIMVSFLYIPKFKSPISFDSSDIYLQKIATLFPELQEAIFIDSAQYNLYNLGVDWPTQFFSILNDIPIVGYRRPNDQVLRDRLTYEFFNKKNGMLYKITFTDFHSPRFAKKDSFVVTEGNSNDYTLSEIFSLNSPELNIRKRIFKKDTLIEMYNLNRRFYSLKNENGDISRLVNFDWSNSDHSLNEIRIASAQGDEEFKVNIQTKYNDNLKIHLPIFNDKTIELSINYKNQTYNTTAIISDDSNLSEACNPNYGTPTNCNFTTTAPFENCNLKIRVYYEPTSYSPIVNIENEIKQLMQCLNIW